MPKMETCEILPTVHYLFRNFTIMFYLSPDEVLIESIGIPCSLLKSPHSSQCPGRSKAAFKNETLSQWFQQ